MPDQNRSKKPPSGRNRQGNKEQSQGRTRNPNQRRRNYNKKRSSQTQRGESKEAKQDGRRQREDQQGRNNSQSNNRSKRPNQGHQRRSHSGQRGQRRGHPTRQSRDSGKRKNFSTREIVSHYLDSIARYLRARKEYFESFRGNSSKRERRSFENYRVNLRGLRKFEKMLKPWQKEELNKTIEYFPEDTEFSNNNPDAELVTPEDGPSEEKVFFHELITQRERPQYADDTEESEGTLEDYNHYKEKALLQ